MTQSHTHTVTSLASVVETFPNAIRDLWFMEQILHSRKMLRRATSNNHARNQHDEPATKHQTKYKLQRSKPQATFQEPQTTFQEPQAPFQELLKTSNNISSDIRNIFIFTYTELAILQICLWSQLLFCNCWTTYVSTHTNVFQAESMIIKSMF